MKKSKKILLIISGGIAAYKTLDLIRSLVSQNFEIKTILTKTAEEVCNTFINFIFIKKQSLSK